MYLFKAATLEFRARVVTVDEYIDNHISHNEVTLQAADHPTV